MLCLVVEDGSEGVRVQPWRRENVGAALAFEEESKPEGNVASLRWVQRFEGPLLHVSFLPAVWEGTRIWPCNLVEGRLTCVGGVRGVHTPSSSRPSSLWRGMTVTSSISHRNAISGGVSPGGRGNAIVATRECDLELSEE